MGRGRVCAFGFAVAGRDMIVDLPNQDGTSPSAMIGRFVG